jgi:hypothetical protein
MLYPFKAHYELYVPLVLFIQYYFVRFSLQTAIISLNSVNQLIFVTVKCCVYFAVRTEFLNVI